MLKKLNMNCAIKVKFTDLGKDIFYHQYDSLIAFMEARGVKSIAPTYPTVDENGYATMQLWSFIELYGPYIGMCKPNVTEDLNFYIEDCDLEDVEPVSKELRKTVKMLRAEYEKAKKQPFVREPLAYALYHVWKMVDGEKR